MKKILPAAIVFAAISLPAFIEFPVRVYEDVPALEAIGDFDPIVVLELFTSQGCSSCPPADRFLNELKQTYDKRVITLSYHVDYWNYIGWEDPFSSNRYSRKQEIYNNKFNNSGNYTPQLVINGKEHMVGSHRGKILAKIAIYSKLPATNKLAVSDVRKELDKINFEYDIEGDITNKNIRALLVLDEKTTKISRGENRNKTLVNSNIVISEKVVELDAAGGALAIAVPKGISPKEKIQLVVLVENDNYDISAAKEVNL
ncbi:MAG: DUF1223 domain-containing protein [Eudoraea sp.]|nr:DUF1223 domain-containing protein [Eudoraea sp.]